MSVRRLCSVFEESLEKQPNIENLDVDDIDQCTIYFKRKDAECLEHESNAFSAVKLYHWLDEDTGKTDLVGYGEFAVPPDVSSEKIEQLKQFDCGTLVHDHTEFGDCNVHHVHLNCTMDESTGSVKKLAEILGC